MLNQDVRDYLEAPGALWKDSPHSGFEGTDKGHGRIEIRRVVATDALDRLAQRKNWRGLTGIALMESTGP